MLCSFWLALTLAVVALAAPHPADTTCTDNTDLSTSYSSTTVVTQSATRTITHTIPASYSATASSSSSSTATYTGNITQPTAPFTVISARSGSPVHLLEMNAAGFRFNLGGNTATYCPTTVSDEGPDACPAGNLTAILGTCAMDTEVPGGQQIWATPDGAIGYTQVHSILMPTGSIPCPFTWHKPAGSSFGYLSTSVFGADGLMACPLNATLGGGWQVFAALQNAAVPSGNVSQCIGFAALTEDYSGPVPAWQYT